MKYAALIVALCLTGFVFSFSTASGDTSASLSLALATHVHTKLIELFPAISLDLDLVHTIIRKAAHVFEFFLLGISWGITFWLWEFRFRYLVLTGLSIVLIDEGIQIFAIDRGPSIVDALLFDFPGFLLAIAIIELAKHMRNKRNVSI